LARAGPVGGVVAGDGESKVTRISNVWIAPACIDRLLAAAPGADGREACGVLLGYRVPLGAEILELAPVRNSHPSGQDAFLMEPQAILEAGRAGRARGLDVVGFWHAHVRGAAWPGALDDDGMNAAHVEGLPPHVHVIVGRGSTGRRVVRAFRESRGGQREVRMTLLRRARGRSTASTSV
jgi:proteasome lid subunit RPN8/RPN11